jgi:hypothetical protein
MLSIVAWSLAALAVVIGVYYLIPNVYHVFASPDPMTTHVKHAIAFFAVAVVLFVGGRFAGNKQSV